MNTIDSVGVSVVAEGVNDELTLSCLRFAAS